MKVRVCINMKIEVTIPFSEIGIHKNVPVGESLVRTMEHVDQELLQEQVDLLHSMSVSDTFVDGDSIIWGLIEFLNDLVDMGKPPVKTCHCELCTPVAYEMNPHSAEKGINKYV